MTLIASISQAEPLTPPQRGEIVSSWSLLALAMTAIGWLGTRIYEMVREHQQRTTKTLERKDEDESLHLTRFIDYTLTQNKDLVAGYKDGVEELAVKVQASIQSQASTQMAYTEDLGRLSGKVDKLHSRLDRLEYLLNESNKAIALLLQPCKKS